jgi:hypothetical protein
MPQLGPLSHTVMDALSNLVVGGLVKVYREGATVNGDQVGTAPITVTIRHPGKISAGDTVFIENDSATLYSVTAVTLTTMTISGFAGVLSVLNGQRIVPSNSQPTIYSDDQGGASVAQPLTTDVFGSIATTGGLTPLWTEGGAYHILASGAGATPRLYQVVVVVGEAPSVVYSGERDGATAVAHVEDTRFALATAGAKLKSWRNLGVERNFMRYTGVMAGEIRYADLFAVGSLTGGIQEAIEDLGSAGGTVHLSGPLTYTITGTTAATASIWLHSNVTLRLNGATIKRGPSSLTTARSVVNACQFGLNGTSPTSVTTISNASIVGPGIIDGNESNFSSNIGAGIEILYCDGVFINGPTIQNCEQDGIAIIECRNVRISNFHIDTVGQAATLTSRNGITLGNNNGTALYSRRATISNGTMFTVGDVAFSTQNWNDVSVNGLSINGAGTALELIGNVAAGATTTGVCINGVVAENLTNTMVSMPLTGATVYQNVTISSSSFAGTAATHNAGAVNIGNDSANSCSHVLFTNCTFTNINTLDTNTRVWVDLHPANPAILDDVRFSNCSFYGKSGSIRNSDVGFNIRESVTNLHLSNVTLRNVAGVGIYIHGTAATASTARALYFANVTVDVSNSHGCKIDCDSTTLTLSEVLFNGCLMKDCGISGSTAAGWYIVGTSVGASVSGIAVRGCRALKTAGTFMTYGYDIDNTGGATISEMTVENTDLRGMQTNGIIVSGTVSKMHFTPLPGRGTDILSAATITIPFDGDVFHVTAANNITNGITVNQQDNGRMVVLVFDSTPTVSDTGTSVLNGNFVATASDTLTIKCDGTNWYELARSAN